MFIIQMYLGTHMLIGEINGYNNMNSNILVIIFTDGSSLKVISMDIRT